MYKLTSTIGFITVVTFEKEPSECTHDQDCELHMGDCSLDDISVCVACGEVIVPDATYCYTCGYDSPWG